MTDLFNVFNLSDGYKIVHFPRLSECFTALFRYWVGVESPASESSDSLLWSLKQIPSPACF